jgi:5,10-methylenetetrahydromethanopterin reductase
VTAALGLGLLAGTVQEAVDLAVHAERIGLDAAWVLDSPGIMPELFTTLAAIRTQTRSLVLGTGVTNVLTRHESVLASAIAGLDQMNPGRAILGLGTGDSAVRMLGMRPAPLDLLEGSVRFAHCWRGSWSPATRRGPATASPPPPRVCRSTWPGRRPGCSSSPAGWPTA